MPSDSRSGGGLAVHVDEDDAAERVAADFRHARAVRDQLRVEGVFVGDVRELAVEAELPAVEGAGEAADAAALVQADLVAAMRADVVERLDRAIGLANDHELLSADFESHVVAFFGDVRGHPSQQPDARPQVLGLLLHELARVIA
jgi:hypothetical protein